jgi:hypothetical protein
LADRLAAIGADLEVAVPATSGYLRTADSEQFHRPRSPMRFKEVRLTSRMHKFCHTSRNPVNWQLRLDIKADPHGDMI